MGNSGPKPKGKIKIKWSSNFAYAIGLIATDGNLSPSGRHIVFTSKDFEQINNFKKILRLTNKIGKKGNGSSKEKKYYVLQFGDVLFYSFLGKIGISPAKSKTIGPIQVPDKFFFDFLRGCFDGDGCSYSYWDKRWKSSFLFYISLASASEPFISWVRKKVKQFVGVSGHVSKLKNASGFQLRYAKNDAKKIVYEMYRKPNSVFLKRKKLKINRSLAIMSQFPKRRLK